MYDPTDHDTADTIEAALDLITEALDLIRSTGLDQEPRFRAYHLAQLEGQEGGWMGGPFLVDALRAEVEASRV